VNLPTPRERFIAALERWPLSGRVPHFEPVFYLTMEAFGKVHPLHRDYSQWSQMEEEERQLHRHDMADLYIAAAGSCKIPIREPPGPPSPMATPPAVA